MNGTSNYLYDGRTLLEEVDQSGNVLARYTQNRRIDEPLAELRSGTTTYYDAVPSGSFIVRRTTDLKPTFATSPGDCAGHIDGSVSSSTNKGSLTKSSQVMRNRAC